jgi:replication initiation and membrane attachment protein DnaB
MSELKQLTNFFSAIKEDPRIGTTHISLYMALFQFYNVNRFQNPIKITRTTVMEVAKISGLATYHKCMKDLVEFGYIQYEPSFNPIISSQVYLLKV